MRLRWTETNPEKIFSRTRASATLAGVDCDFYIEQRKNVYSLAPTTSGYIWYLWIITGNDPLYDPRKQQPAIDCLSEAEAKKRAQDFVDRYGTKIGGLALK